MSVTTAPLKPALSPEGEQRVRVEAGDVASDGSERWVSTAVRKVATGELGTVRVLLVLGIIRQETRRDPFPPPL